MTTTYTRRDIIKRGTAVAAAGTALPLMGRVGTAIGLTGADPATARRNRLIVILLDGGNDGLNTVTPVGDISGAPRRSVYDKVRSGIGYGAGALLPLDRGGDADQALGLNPSLTNLHGLYNEGRVAIVQGVDYPNHSFSHFNSKDIWESGQPEKAPDSGWLGRHLDRVGIGEGEIRGLAVSHTLPLTLRGRAGQGTNFSRVPPTFRDGNGEAQRARQNSLRQFADYPESDRLRHLAGRNAAHTVDVVRGLQAQADPANPQQSLVRALVQARSLLEGNYGCEVVFVRLGGFDTHAFQRSVHERLLSHLDRAIAVFLSGEGVDGLGPLDSDVASRTLIMTMSEFGRRVRQNGSLGTDHGAAGPLFLIGPPGGRLAGGLHGDHPDMGTPARPADDLPQTTDVRSVYQSVLTEWLGDPDPDLGATLPGLFSG